MLQGIETIFEDRKEMLRHLKKKSYEANTKTFREKYGRFFQEMTAYAEASEDKEKAADEIGEVFVQAVQEHFQNKRGKVDSGIQVDLNFFMIYYVFPTILAQESECSKQIADAVCRAWGEKFKDSSIQYTDYDTLYGAFREKIFGIF